VPIQNFSLTLLLVYILGEGHNPLGEFPYVSMDARYGKGCKNGEVYDATIPGSLSSFPIMKII